MARYELGAEFWDITQDGARLVIVAGSDLVLPKHVSLLKQAGLKIVDVRTDPDDRFDDDGYDDGDYYDEVQE